MTVGGWQDAEGVYCGGAEAVYCRGGECVYCAGKLCRLRPPPVPRSVPTYLSSNVRPSSKTVMAGGAWCGDVRGVLTCGLLTCHCAVSSTSRHAPSLVDV